MATVMNVTGHAQPLSTGTLGPRQTAVVDPTLQPQATLIAEHALVVVDPNTVPTAPDELLSKTPAGVTAWTGPPGAEEFLIRRPDGLVESVAANGLLIRDPSTAQNQVNELVVWKQNHPHGPTGVPGKWLQLTSSFYDNSAAQLVVPDGFRLIGDSRDNTVVVTCPAGVNAVPADWGIGSSAEHVSWLASGNNANPGWGRSPSPGAIGHRMRSAARFSHCNLIGYHAAWELYGNNIFLDDCQTFNCFVGLFRSANGQTRGNLKLYGNRFTGCTFAAFYVDSLTEEDSMESRSNYYSESPYGFYADNGGSPHQFGWTNLFSSCDSFENLGNRQIQLGTRKISGDMHTPRTGALDSSKTITTGDAPVIGPDRNYVFEGGNVDPTGSGPTRTTSDGKFSIHGSGGDTTNGPFLTPGATAVFHKTL